MMVFFWKMLSWDRPDSTVSGRSDPRYEKVLYLAGKAAIHNERSWERNIKPLATFATWCGQCVCIE